LSRAFVFVVHPRSFTCGVVGSIRSASVGFWCKSPIGVSCCPVNYVHPALILRRANVSRKGGHWDDNDFDVFDGDRDVGRIYQMDRR